MKGPGELSRSSSPDLLAVADALGVLAALVASGRSVAQAVQLWPDFASRRCATEIDAVRRQFLLTQGRASPVRSAPGPRTSLLLPVVAAAAAADRTSGASSVAVLRSAAESYRCRASDLQDAAASTAGAKLSGRLIASLPIAFVLLVPFGGLPRFDRFGLLTAAVGVALLIAGMRWMARLMPVPGPPPPAAEVAGDLAVQVRAGIPLLHALTSASERHAWAPLRRAARSTSLGLGWEQALRIAGDREAAVLAAIIAAGRSLGCGPIEGLERYREQMVAAHGRAFEERLRRAPVLMVLPLVTCILPGFALLALGPFLRRIVA